MFPITGFNIPAVSNLAHPRSSHTVTKSLSSLKASFGLPDIPYIPALVVSTALVFAIFNIDTDIDLTDAGKAEARRKKRAERLVRGEDLSGKANPLKGEDPYRWRIFEDETDDDNFQLLDGVGSKKGGGGCG